jgi:hypothetical protein
VFYLLILPAIAYALLALHYGFWLSLLGGAALFTVEIIILSSLGERAKKQASVAALAAASAPPPGPRPPPAYTVSTAPAGVSGSRQDPPAGPEIIAVPPPVHRGPHLNYQALSFDLGEPPDQGQEHTLHRQLYEGMRNALATHVALESGPGGTPAAMLDAEAPAQQEGAQASAPACTIFCTHDGQWAGMRYGGESLRFSPAHLSGLMLEVATPARGAGGYRVFLEFDIAHAPDARYKPSKNSAFELGLPYSAQRSESLFAALSQMAALYGVAVRRVSYSDC